MLVEVRLESQESEQAVVHFSVQDTGVGIPADKQKKIFESFCQADSSTTRRFGGTGLGLTICAQLVELMKGRIWVDSEVGQGSTFHFTIGFGVDTEETKENLLWKDVNFERKYPVEMQHKEGMKNIHVLLAEDNILNQKVAARILEKEGYSVIIVSNGREALEALEKHQFNLVLMDMQMPDLDGIKTTQTIRASKDSAFDSEIPIIALTANAFEKDRERCLNAGMNGFISKPFNKKELLDNIKHFTSAVCYSLASDNAVLPDNASSVKKEYIIDPEYKHCNQGNPGEIG